MANESTNGRSAIREYALDMARKNGTVLAIKSAPVIARKAVPGEIIRTWSQDGEETVNSAGEDCYVLSKADKSTGKPMLDGSGHDNSWIIQGDTFRSSYCIDGELQDGQMVEPKSALRTLVRIDEDKSIETSWGETQHISAGGYLNITDPNDIYGVSERDFNDTHAMAPESAKFIDPKQDNPFWAKGRGPLSACYLDLAAESDEDTFDEASRQADALGMESLIEDQQVLVGSLKRQGLEDAWQFLDDTGFDSGKLPHEIDTGRYMQISVAGAKPIDVYESVPVARDGDDVHVFWDLSKGADGAMELYEAEYEPIGVYDGKPFQLQRDAIAEEIGLQVQVEREAAIAVEQQAQAKAAERGPAPGSAARMLFDHVAEQDARDGSQPGPDGPEVG